MNASTQLTRRNAVCAWRRRARDERGQSLVEFVLALPILLVLVFGIIEFAAAWRTYQVVTNVAREGARLGVVTSTSSGQTVLDRVDSLLVWSNLSLSRRTTTIRCYLNAGGTVNNVCTTTQPGNRFEVQLDYQHDFVVLGPVLNLMCSGCGSSGYGTVTLRSRAVMREE